MTDASGHYALTVAAGQQIEVNFVSSISCDLYPIALNAGTLNGVVVGQELEDIYNGSGPGNFGWLTWTGDQSVGGLVRSLTPPGASESYINPADPSDHRVSLNDWVKGRTGVSNARDIRTALDGLKPLSITVPVWDRVEGQGSNLRYHIVGFARIQITDYNLPARRISATFQGYAACRP